MKELLKAFEEKAPEIVFEWNDTETEAKGWVVINSLRGGAAGGGTRMRKGLDKREVESLAKTMEVKFTVSGPPIGGAKSGIDFDPADPRKAEVLERWFKAVLPLLKTYYGTGGDMNIDEVHEVIPVTTELGLLHPQEGVANGHLGFDKEHKQKSIGNLQKGVSLVLKNKEYSPDVTKQYKVADMITGYGVAMSVKHYYDAIEESCLGKKVVVQGWGNVGAAAGFYLSQMGFKLVGIIDRNGGVINQEGYSFEEVAQMFVTRNGNALSIPNMLDFKTVDEKIWSVNADVFIPAAASRLLQKVHVTTMINEGGIELIACGANVPFADKEIFYGPICELADEAVAVIPDFISNCGMARVFAYLLNIDASLEEERIFDDVSSTMRTAIKKVMEHRAHAKKRFTSAAFEVALEQLT